jgi:hypothetical protein
MRTARVLKRSAAVIAAVAGVGLAAADPASASLPPGAGGQGTWQAFGNTNPITSSSSSWFCASSHQIGVDVTAQVCVIISRDHSVVQPAVIVRNDKPVEYDAQATMDLVAVDDGGQSASYVCVLSGVAAHSWSVCFGNSVPNNSRVFAHGTAGNSVDLGTSPEIL